MNFTKGDRVRHPGKPEWDMGQVLEDCAGQDVRVYFVGGGERKLRLDYVTLERVEGDEAANPVLDSLGKRQPRTAAAGAKRGKRVPRARGLAQLAEDFTRLFPEGFHGAEFQRAERDSKFKAHETLTDLLGREKVDALIAAGDHAEVGRRAVQVIAATNLVFPREAISLKNGLKDEDNQRLFAESLRSLLYGDTEVGSRFAAFCDRLAEMGAAKWPLATYFPFIAFPEREMFLKPTVTRKVAEMLGFELNYSVEPNWLTYSKLREMSRHLFDSLAELRPRDMFDVQSFISRVAGYEESEQSEGETAAADANETTPARAAGTKAPATPAGGAADAGVPPWAARDSDAGGAGAAETPPGAGATSSDAAAAAELADEPDAAVSSSDEAADGARVRPEDSAGAGARSEIPEGASIQPEDSDDDAVAQDAVASGAGSAAADAESAGSAADAESGASAQPATGDVTAVNEESGAGDESNAGDGTGAADEGRGGGAATD